MKLFKKIISILTILFFVLAILVIINVSFAIRNKKVPIIFGYSVMNVETGSMEPELKVNDIIIVKKRAKYDVNDIISFYYDTNNDGVNDKVVTHKIIDIGAKIITHGVNNPDGDNEEINADQIVGKVVFKSTFLGKVLANDIVTNKQIILLIIIIFLVIFIIYSIVNIVRIVKSKDSM